MRERFGATNPRSWQLRFHAQTAGVSLTAQQPYNNVVRTAIQAMAAVLGGTQSLHTNALDEALALPTEQAATLAVRTQQILAHETGITDVVDPLGGAYFVERLTSDLERDALAYFDTIDRMGGMVEAIERGFPQREIAESAYAFQQAVERRDMIVVGVNEFVSSGRGTAAPHVVHRRDRRRNAGGEAGGVEAAPRRCGRSRVRWRPSAARRSLARTRCRC